MKSEEERPLAITQMGFVVNFDARIVTGFTGIIARIDEVKPIRFPSGEPPPILLERNGQSMAP